MGLLDRIRGIDPQVEAEARAKVRRIDKNITNHELTAAQRWALSHEWMEPLGVLRRVGGSAPKNKKGADDLKSHLK
jgi:hypothetical protein